MNEHSFQESLSSNRTEALFIALTIVFSVLSYWRMSAVGMTFLTGVFLFFALFFLFYSFNYRTLLIRLSEEALILRFGIFTWTIALTNIEDVYLCDISLWRIGGAGIHFTWIRGRYRAFFNFLEYPRVVVVLKEKKGPVKEVTFSTQFPDDVMKLIKENIIKIDP
jgi:hypothetical protein